MAEPITGGEPITAGEPANPVDKNAGMEELKAFMGEAYKEGITLNDISAFLKGKKYADLNSGDYVGKKKYADLEKKYNDYVEQTKDYMSLKDEVASYKQKEHRAALEKQAAAANIDEQFIEFALSQIDPEAEDTEKALKEWTKTHPQFLKHQTRVIESGPSLEKGRGPKKDMNSTINGNLRAAAGRTE